MLMSVMSITALGREPYILHNPTHDEKFDPLSKVDYHVDYYVSKLVKYKKNNIAGSNNVNLIVFPECFYVAKFKKDKETVAQYCGAKLEGVTNDRYKSSGLDTNGYWDMRKIEENPDNEFASRYNFNLEKDGDITFNLVRYLHSVTIVYSCEQEFNTEGEGLSKNLIPVCKMEAMGRKGRKLEEMFDQFSPKEYWNKLDAKQAVQ